MLHLEVLGSFIRFLHDVGLDRRCLRTPIKCCSGSWIGMSKTEVHPLNRLSGYNHLRHKLVKQIRQFLVARLFVQAGVA